MFAQTVHPYNVQDRIVYALFVVWCLLKQSIRTTYRTGLFIICVCFDVCLNIADHVGHPAPVTLQIHFRMELELAAALVSSFIIIAITAVHFCKWRLATILFLQWNIFVLIQHVQCTSCEKERHNFCRHNQEHVVISEEMVVWAYCTVCPCRSHRTSTVQNPIPCRPHRESHRGNNKWWTDCTFLFFFSMCCLIC